MRRELKIIILLAGAFVSHAFFAPLSQKGIQMGTHPVVLPDLPYFPPLPQKEMAPALTEEGIQLGRMLFFDPILSLDSSISCASCHKPSNAFADDGKRFSVGIRGLPQARNTPALFNLAWYEAFFWDGRAASIEAQVFEPVRKHDEMDLEWPQAVLRLQRSQRYQGLFEAAFGEGLQDSALVAAALGQFMRTMLSYQSKYDRVLRREDKFSDDEYQGFVIINDQSMGNCLHCHVTDAHALGTTGGFSNNGLQHPNASGYDPGMQTRSGSEADRGRFKIPSLRNLGFTAPYMHDGSLSTLEEVLEFYTGGVNHQEHIDAKMAHAKQGGVSLSKEQKRQVIAFLHTLNDSVFVNDPQFSNPF